MPSNFIAKETDLDDIFILRSETTYDGLYPIGKLWSWGINDFGQLGQGNITNLSSPKQVGALTTWSSVATAGGATLAVDSSNKLWSWGQNDRGQLGHGDLTFLSSPKQVGALTDWAKISVGNGSVTAAIKTDNTLWMWGYSYELPLSTSSPQQIGSLTDWDDIKVGTTASFYAIKTDGTLWAWGNGHQGILGHGNWTSYSSPKQVGSLNDWKIVQAGRNLAIAIKNDNSIWSWGVNNMGQLGLGDKIDRSSPVQIGLLTDWRQISACDIHCAAIKFDGTLWAWGYNGYGEIGLGTISPISIIIPTQIGTLTNWKEVAVGGFNTLAIKTDGTLWSWGRNNYGQLGQGNITDLSSPKQVGALTNWSKLHNCSGSTGGTQIRSITSYNSLVISYL